jgi:hypothetical protein
LLEPTERAHRNAVVGQAVGQEAMSGEGQHRFG